MLAEISKRFGINERILSNCMRNAVGYRTRKLTGRPSILTFAEKMAKNRQTKIQNANIRKATHRSRLMESHISFYRHVLEDRTYGNKLITKTNFYQARQITSASAELQCTAAGLPNETK